MPSDKPAPVPTQLYAIEVRDAETETLCHVISHPVRSPSPATAVWEALRVYPFRIRHWKLKAVPAETYFPRPEAAA